MVIKADVEVNEDMCDSGGEVLDVEEISPLRSRILTGCITHWNQNGEGVIDHNVYFSQDSCEPGYVPHLGDNVEIKAIESEQGKHMWRALTTVPEFSHSTRTKADQGFHDSAQNYDKLEILLEEKKGIVVTKCLNFGVLNVGEERELTAEVTNNGIYSQFFVRGKFHSRRSESQFILHHPRDGESYEIYPGQTVNFHFGCKGRFIGNSSELFVFTFKGFKIGRNLQVDVRHPLHTSIAPSHYERRFNHYDAQQKAYQTKNTGMLISGVRPIKPPAFVPVRLGSFPIPDRLRQAVIGNCGQKRSTEDVKVAVENVVPCLISDLNVSNYTDRFHMLLYLEEIHAVLNMQNYDLERVCFRIAGPGGEFLALEVPGLAERRPSLLLGDRVIASSPVAQDNTGKCNMTGVCTFSSIMYYIMQKMLNRFISSSKLLDANFSEIWHWMICMKNLQMNLIMVCF